MTGKIVTWEPMIESTSKRILARYREGKFIWRRSHIFKAVTAQFMNNKAVLLYFNRQNRASNPPIPTDVKKCIFGNVAGTIGLRTSCQ